MTLSIFSGHFCFPVPQKTGVPFLCHCLSVILVCDSATLSLEVTTLCLPFIHCSDACESGDRPSWRQEPWIPSDCPTGVAGTQDHGLSAASQDLHLQEARTKAVTPMWCVGIPSCTFITVSLSKWPRKAWAGSSQKPGARKSALLSHIFVRDINTWGIFCCLPSSGTPIHTPIWHVNTVSRIVIHCALPATLKQASNEIKWSYIVPFLFILHPNMRL